MVELSWEYAAGFIDGEGYIGVSKKCSGRIYKDRHYKYDRYRFSISQTEQNEQAIYELEKFLKQHNINCHVYKRKYKYQKNPVVILQMTHHMHIKNMLLELYPYLIVKKEVALKIIKSISNRKWENDH